jgi:hypothetical protein
VTVRIETKRRCAKEGRLNNEPGNWKERVKVREREESEFPA